VRPFELRDYSLTPKFAGVGKDGRAVLALDVLVELHPRPCPLEQMGKLRLAIPSIAWLRRSSPATMIRSNAHRNAAGLIWRPRRKSSNTARPSGPATITSPSIRKRIAFRARAAATIPGNRSAQSCPLRV
jgi:hypothetical protein